MLISRTPDHQEYSSLCSGSVMHSHNNNNKSKQQTLKLLLSRIKHSPPTPQERKEQPAGQHLKRNYEHYTVSDTKQQQQQQQKECVPYTAVLVFTKREGEKKSNNSNNGDILKEERRGSQRNRGRDPAIVLTGSTSWLTPVTTVTMCVAVPEKYCM